MIRKLTQKEKKGLIVSSGAIVGLYMVFILNNPRGWLIVFLSGLIFLFMKGNGGKG